MSNYKAIRTLISQISGQENILVVPKIFIKLTGDLTTATLLNQIVFYSDKSKRTDGYFYKSYKEWEAEICLTKRQVKYSADKLKSVNLIETKTMKANGAPTVHYKLDYDKLLNLIVTNCNDGLLQNVTINSNKTSQTLDSNKMSLSITEIENTTEITTEKPKTSRHKFKTCDINAANYLFEKIKSNNPKHKTPNLDTWANDFRLMREKDNRELEEIKDVIDWCQLDSFWKGNILSPKKLREKFDQLTIQMTSKKGVTSNARNQKDSSFIDKYDFKKR
ncbi:hypothetical protein [Bacillus cereus]|uniref:Replication protein n=1 Tax=Bacillus cereus TIAC219 TaxID=718222 RepID=A0ABC9SU14_BACCE|nr:hypothetical protein [Bacillus cereus]EJP84672.1 hypothetical protein IC1_05200 [Bacillus cereus VD022]EOQ59355.1 hypothetical protein IAY_05091 [Bacillus cereus TIAC219]